MGDRPTLSLAAHLNGRAWAVQLGKTGGGGVDQKSAVATDRVPIDASLNRNIPRARAEHWPDDAA